MFALIIFYLLFHKLCSMFELFDIPPPTTYSERTLQDTGFDQNEPALISGIDTPTDEPPKHGDGTSSGYNLDLLFDEEHTSGEQSSFYAASEATVTPDTSPNEHKVHEAANDEEMFTDYSLDLLFNDVPGEHGESTTAVDASGADAPTQAMGLQAVDDALAGDESSTIHPQNQEVSNDDTQHRDANPQGVSADNEPRVNAPIAEHTPVGVTSLRAPLEKASAMDTSEKHASADGAPVGRAPIKSRPIEMIHIEYAHVQQTPVQRSSVQDEVMEGYVIEVAPTQDAPMADVTMDDLPKEDTTMSDALTTAELNPADAADAFRTLTLVPQTISAPHNGFIKPEAIQSPTFSPLSLPGTSPPPKKGLQRILTASKIAGTLQPAARKREVDRAGYSAGPDAKRRKADPTTTPTTAPLPRVRRRQRQSVSTRGFGATKIATRSITRGVTRKATTRSAAPKLVLKPWSTHSAPPARVLGKRKLYTINLGPSTPPPSPNKRLRLSPPPTPAPPSSPTFAAKSRPATSYRGRTAPPTITARHTRSKGPQCLIYISDIMGLERGLRRMRI